MPNIRVALPSHINTIPFIFGLQHHDVKDEIVLNLMEFPNSVQMLKSKKVDIALVPLEALQQFDHYHVMGDYCLSSQREMQFIFLILNGDFSNLTTIYIDDKSQVATSLVHILTKGYWKCSPKFRPLPSSETINNLKFGEAVLLAGNEDIAENHKQDCLIDLSAEWKKFTGLPLVVAVWVSLEPLHQTFTDQFNDALRLGINSIDVALEGKIFSNDFPKAKVRRQLSQGISYMFDHEKTISMQLFLQLQAKIKVASAI